MQIHPIIHKYSIIIHYIYNYFLKNCPNLHILSFYFDIWSLCHFLHKNWIKVLLKHVIYYIPSVINYRFNKCQPAQKKKKCSDVHWNLREKKLRISQNWNERKYKNSIKLNVDSKKAQSILKFQLFQINVWENGNEIESKHLNSIEQSISYKRKSACKWKNNPPLEISLKFINYLAGWYTSK